jgi:hypothetical protein
MDPLREKYKNTIGEKLLKFKYCLEFFVMVLLIIKNLLCKEKTKARYIQKGVES